tara:strand:- start:954 stop:3464 length:2511 start_codon:yes stop_codon:yes gene_type:complete
MPINQYDNPVRYEYKPLGLDKLAGPMAALQQKFDVTQATLDDAEFNLQHTKWGTDDERAKAIIGQFEEKRDAIADELMGTKNFRKATQQLKNLNKSWTKSPEALALSSNYALHKQFEEEQRKRLMSGDIDQSTYDYFKDKSIRDYENKGGTSYSMVDGQENYNAYNRIHAIADMGEEFEDLKLKIANLSPEKRISGMRAAGIDETVGDQKYIKTIVESKDAGEVENAVENYLKGVDRFKPWLEQKANVDLYDKKKNHPQQYLNEAVTIVNSVTNSLNDQISKWTKKAEDDKDPALLESDQFKALVNKRDELEKASEDKGEVFMHNADILLKAKSTENMYDAEALGELLAYKNVTQDWSWRSLANKNGGGSDMVDLANMFDGFVKDEYNEVSNVSIGKQKWNAVVKLRPELNSIMSVGGGILGKFVNGWEGSKFESHMKKNVGGQYRRLQHITALKTQSKNGVDFHYKLWKAGYTQGNNKANAAKLFETLTPDTVYQITEKLENNASTYNRYNTAKTQQRIVNENLRKNKEFVNKFKGVILSHLEDMGAIKDGFLGKNFANKGITNKILKLLDLPNVGLVDFSPIIQRYFETAELDNKTIKELKKEFSELTGTSEQMTYTYVNNPKLNTVLGNTINNSSMASFTPAYNNNWKNQPGFDPKTGFPLDGTGFTGDPVHLQVQAGLVLYKAKYKYLDNGESKEKFVTIQPKNPNGEFNRMLLDIVDRNTQGSSEYDKTTNALIKATQFDTKYGNYLSDELFKSSAITDNPVLQAVPVPGKPGLVLEFIKTKNSLGESVIQLQTSNISGKTVPYRDPNTNILKNFDTPNGAKEYAWTKILN